jgi:hypothetical protein
MHKVLIMKVPNNLLWLIMFSIMLFACDKTIVNPPEIIEDEVLQNQDKVLLTGDFKAAAHPTSGMVQVINDNGVRKLKFANFKTDSGPDLRIYLAEDDKALNFIEISNKVENGNLLYLLPDEFNIEKQTYVLIWCKLFKVNFGTAILKTPQS